MPETQASSLSKSSSENYKKNKELSELLLEGQNQESQKRSTNTSTNDNNSSHSSLVGEKNWNDGLDNVEDCNRSNRSNTSNRSSAIESTLESDHTLGHTRSRTLSPAPSQISTNSVGCGGNNNNNNNNSKSNRSMASSCSKDKERGHVRSNITKPPPGSPEASIHILNPSRDASAAYEMESMSPPFSSLSSTIRNHAQTHAKAHAQIESQGYSAMHREAHPLYAAENALVSNIQKATLVLTHVVQTMKVPSPSNLLRVTTSLDVSTHKINTTQLWSQDEPSCFHRTDRASTDKEVCEGAGAGEGRNRGLDFLVAFYSPDPWEYQSRVIRQIDAMQRELDFLRQEAIEVQKRATIRLRQDLMEWERRRDVEWVELNERMNGVMTMVLEDNDPEVEVARRSQVAEVCDLTSQSQKRSNSVSSSLGGYARATSDDINVRTWDKSKTKAADDEEAWKVKAATIHNSWVEGAVGWAVEDVMMGVQEREE